MENDIELFLSIYQSGGMSVYGNIHSFKIHERVSNGSCNAQKEYCKYRNSWLENNWWNFCKMFLQMIFYFLKVQKTQINYLVEKS